MKSFRAPWLVLGALLLAPAVRAAEPPIALEPRETVPGSLETVIELTNQHDVAVSGRIELVSADYSSLGGSSLVPVAETPFTLGPNATGRVMLPATNTNRYSMAARVVLADGTSYDAEIGGGGGRGGGQGPNVFVELGGSSGLLGALSDTQVTTSSGTRENVNAVMPSMPARGGAAFPTTLGGYSNASLVHLTTKRLLELGGVELEALVDYVAHAGTLAVSVDDPAHLADPKLVALLGGVATAIPAELGMFGSAVLLQRQVSNYDSTATTTIPGSVTPAPATVLTTFVGGNTERTPYGSIAAYGMGRVVLLPFHAGRAADDPWAIGKLAELTIDSTRNRKSRFSEISQQQLGGDLGRVQHALDPNQRFRITLGIATALLLVYAGVVAWGLLRDQKNRRLFRAFVWLPVLATSLSAAIVVLGFATRGTHRGIRRVLLIEGGAGFGLVTVDEYRGYFTSGSEPITLPSHAPRSLLYANELGAIHQRDGFSFLREKPRLPWQTTVTRELWSEQSTEHVDLGETSGVPWVRNATKATLEDAFVIGEDAHVYYVPRIEPGETVQFQASQLASSALEAVSYAFDPDNFGALPSDERAKLGERFEVLTALTQSRAPYLEGTLSLVARATGPVPYVHQQETESQGLALATVQTYVHVVGEGGAR